MNNFNDNMFSSTVYRFIYNRYPFELCNGHSKNNLEYITNKILKYSIMFCSGFNRFSFNVYPRIVTVDSKFKIVY